MRQRPNVLLIQTDQHAPHIAGFAGDPVARTPHLDHLAENGIRFSNATCAYPLCTPSRMCMLTGKEAHRCAAWSNHWLIFPEHATWPGHFSDHGYTTLNVGKLHLGGRDQLVGFQHRPYGDLRHGVGHQAEPLSSFPAYESIGSAGETEIPESLISDHVITREALGFLLELGDREPGTPWFAHVSYTRPHSPYTIPGRYLRRHQGRIPLPDPPLTDDSSLDPYTRSYYRRAKTATYSEEELVQALEAYYACVDYVDDQIGTLLRELDEADMLDDTYVIYTADHGEMGGSHGLWGKQLYYRESMGVPLLISGPDLPRGKTCEGLVSHLDLFPTMCSLTGLPSPQDTDGFDLKDLLSDPAAGRSPRTYAPSEFFVYGVLAHHHNYVEDGTPGTAMRVIQDERWKYVEIQGEDSLLFDTREDPRERQNLIDDPERSSETSRLRDALRAGFDWDETVDQLRRDRERLPQFLSGRQPTTPNQYRLPDGRLFDAEKSLYDARWLPLPRVAGGIIPQRFG